MDVEVGNRDVVVVVGVRILLGDGLLYLLGEETEELNTSLRVAVLPDCKGVLKGLAILLLGVTDILDFGVPVSILLEVFVRLLKGIATLIGNLDGILDLGVPL